MLYFKKLNDKAVIPVKSSPKASGYDLVSVERIEILPGTHEAVNLGFSMYSTTSTNLDLQIRPRSGLALKHGITVLNSPGTVDIDYTGEWKVILINHGYDTYIVNVGDRIAQLVVGLRVDLPTVFPVDGEIHLTDRSGGGFGSTGR